jgi:hypothetical protein
VPEPARLQGRIVVVSPHLVVAILLFAAACRSDAPPPAPGPTPAPATGSGSGSGSANIDANPPAANLPADAETLKEHMREHFAAVSELQRAIARGHLDQAKQLADWLVTHDEHLLDGWKPFVDELKDAARAVAAAPDLPTAGSVASRLGRACSRCHEERTAIVTFAWEPSPTEDATLNSQMKRHQWAAARLWDGLVGPSDDLWTEGAKVLSTAKLDVLAATGGVEGRGDVTALTKKVHELAIKATTMTDHDQRAALYGELLSTCAGCHALVRPRAVPGP